MDLSEEQLSNVRQLIWPSTLAKSDTDRWHQQGLQFSDDAGTRFGLLQTQGGPCGLLAAVQAYMLKNLLFLDTVGVSKYDLFYNDLTSNTIFSTDRGLGAC